MKLLSFPRILRCFFSSEKKVRGNATLMTIFFFLIFSLLGINLLLLSQITLKWSSFKKHSTLLDYASENGIKDSFHHFINSLIPFLSPVMISSEKWQELKVDVQVSSLRIIRDIMGAELPFSGQGKGENLGWQHSLNFFVEKIKDFDNFFFTSYRFVIISRGNVLNFEPSRQSSLEGILDIAAGHIPLILFPFLLDQPLAPGENENFEKESNLPFILSKRNLLEPQATFSESPLIPDESLPLAERALKIKIFSPQKLPLPQLRRALGLGESNEPVPEGVYLVQDDLGLGGIYVEGDLDELVAAIDGDFQVLLFSASSGTWKLKFSPKRGKTFFITPHETLSFDLLPLGIIIVNGHIRSLCGGIVNFSGEVIPLQDEEIPCLLNGVRLTIISSEEIRLTSHLIHQGIQWQEGIPYAKDSQTQLVIFSTGQDFWRDEEKVGGIIIADEAPQKMKVQASLVASSKGLRIEGEGKAVELLGSVQTKGFQSHGNKIKIIFDSRLWKDSEFLAHSPQTKSAVLWALFLKAHEWKEYQE